MEERVDIKNILFYLLKRWKWVIVLGMIGMLIGGGYSYNIQKKMDDTSLNFDVMAIQNECEELQQKIEFVNEGIDYSLKAFSSRKNYWDESIKMHMDWSAMNKQIAWLQVAGSGSDWTVQYALDYCRTEEYLNAVKERVGMKIENQYLQEFLGISQAGYSVQFYVFYDDAEVCENIVQAAAEILLEELEDNRETYQELFMFPTDEEIKPLEFQIKYGQLISYVDWNLKNEQDGNQASANYNTAQNLNNQLEINQKQVAELEEQLMEKKALLEQTNVDQNTISKKKIVLMALIVGIIFSIIGAIGILLRYLMSTKVVGSGDMKQYRVPVIVEYMPLDSRKKLFDAVINRWEHKYINDISESEFIETTTLMLGNLLQEQEIKNVLLVDEKESEIIGEIVQNIGKEIKVAVLKSIKFDENSINKLKEVQGIIKIVYKDYTSKNSMYQELELMRKNGKECIGTIIF